MDAAQLFSTVLLNERACSRRCGSWIPADPELSVLLDLYPHFRTQHSLLHEVDDQLDGATIVVCMGDRLTLAAFTLAMPIWPRILASVTTTDEALARVEQHKPDLLFVTEELEQGYGIGLVREVERLHPATRTMIFLRRENPLVVEEALEAGADGVMFISRIGSSQADFLHALRTTRDGGVYYPDDVRDMARQTSVQDPDVLRRIAELSEREREVRRALTAGQTNREIAETLFISGETVKSHVSAIIGKLGVRDRTQAAILAIRNGEDGMPALP